MGLRRLRGRLDAMQSDVHGTLATARDVLEDFRDGFYVEVEVLGNRVPVRIRIIADEEAEALKTGGEVQSISVVLGKLFGLIGGKAAQ